ncbi:DbpA RNA binding domain-containing protein, partial [Halopseudomonas sp.]|uniref:DbpA RNA binding domain-containing protein n=1 Tax=Halopseudomonas sp. TaxID=2901191 RepID=UPI00356343AE
MPKPLVDALCRHGGLQRQQIGHIKLFNEHSGVYLPELSEATLAKLALVEINGVTLQIRAWPLPAGESEPPTRPRPRKDFASKPRTAKPRPTK